MAYPSTHAPRVQSTPYMQQVFVWGERFCEEALPLAELHARFCGSPVQLGDPLLEDFPDLGWRFRAEMEDEAS